MTRVARTDKWARLFEWLSLVSFVIAFVAHAFDLHEAAKFQMLSAICLAVWSYK